MRYVSFLDGDRAGWGRLDGDDVVDLTSPEFPDLKSALAVGPSPSAGNGPTLRLDDIRLLPPVPDPGKILCVGHNYEDHRIETGRASVGHPSIFPRFADTLVGDGAAIVMPPESTMLDFEGELAVVIGTGGRRIAEADAMRHVAGYACANDASIRDWQHHTGQFTPGKNWPATGGFGPWLVTPDDIADLDSATLTTRLNGVVVQQAAIAQQIFSIPVVIAYLSTFTALAPGDVILTGTPGGVGAKRQPPLWMKAGDIVEVAIDDIGVLRNPITVE